MHLAVHWLVHNDLSHESCWWVFVLVFSLDLWTIDCTFLWKCVVTFAKLLNSKLNYTSFLKFPLYTRKFHYQSEYQCWNFHQFCLKQEQVTHCCTNWFPADAERARHEESKSLCELALIKGLFSRIIASAKHGVLLCDVHWCLNRHLCILPERFCKKRPEFGHCVSQRRNVITLWCNVTLWHYIIMLWRNVTSWRHVHGDGCFTDTSGLWLPV